MTSRSLAVAAPWACGGGSRARDVLLRCFALAIGATASACGQVAGDSVDAAVIDSPDAALPATTYKAQLAATPPVTFGGPPYCMYTMTLQQLQVELAIQPNGNIVSGSVQDLNLEAKILPCTVGVIPPKIATYTFESAKPAPTGMTLTFRGATANEPTVALTATLTPAGGSYSIVLGFRRSIADPLLAWAVVATLALTPQ